jgi:hypothetical protein
MKRLVLALALGLMGLPTTAEAADVTACDELNGFYWCFKDDGCDKPAGVVCIAHHEGQYIVTWTYSPEVDGEGKITVSNTVGVGKRHGKALAVMCGKAVYAYEIHPGAKGHVEITGEGERWAKIKGPCCVSLDAPAARASRKRGDTLAARSFPLPHPAPPCEDCKCKKAGYECNCGKGDGCDCVITVTEQEDGTKETIIEPPAKVKPGPYDHLPPERVCGENYHASQLWREGVEREAKELGYLWLNTDPELWDGVRLVWVGGGWHAQGMREEIEDCKIRARVWNAVWWLRWPAAGKEDLDFYEAELRSLIGHAAYCRGQIPSPFPVWRVRRAPI